MPAKSGNRKVFEYIIEFVLVVLGISLAFWLGERSEHRKENQLQQEYLENLLIDLQSDVDLIDYLMVLDQGKSEVLKTVIDFSNGTSNDLTLDSIPDLIIEMSKLDLFYPNDFTYVTLTQSGDFKIIKSQEIRNLLVKLYSSYQSIDLQQTNLVNSLENNFFPEFYRNYRMTDNKIISRNYFKGATLVNYVDLTIDKLNTISIYFDRSKTLAEQAIEIITEELK